MRYTIILLALILFSGCKSLEKQKREANNYFDRYPAQLALKCNDKFPVLDSSSEIKYDTLSSSNINYKVQIDSLVDAGENLAVRLVFTKRQADSISEQCADAVLGYMRDLDILNRRIKSMSSSYKPCAPDTIVALREVFRRSLAREAILEDSLAQYKYQLGEMTDQSNNQASDLMSQERENDRLRSDKNGWMWKAIGTWIGMALILGGLLFLKMKSV
jgi:hypothetical protein